jgi:ATP-dependent Clp protease ATP-binding subunit ClpC
MMATFMTVLLLAWPVGSALELSCLRNVSRARPSRGEARWDLISRIGSLTTGRYDARHHRIGPPHPREEGFVAGSDRDPFTPDSLDHAMAWIEKSLDELTDAARRQGEAIRQASAGPILPTSVTPSQTVQGRPSPADIDSMRRLAAQTLSQTPLQRAAPETTPAAAPAPQPRPATGATPPATTTASAEVSTSATPLLDSLGRDLTALAKAGQLTPIVGRQEEIDAVIEILVRSTKRNPVLLGPAGAGKTAIVEGLAERIAAGNVPDPVLNTRIVEIPLASLVAGTSYRGQLEERLQALVKEASQPGIVLFFDEIHLLAGAGKSEGGMGADQVFKPALARGDIAVIGATTPDEYHATIEKDDALARRFTTLAIAVLTKEQCRPILAQMRDQIAKSRGVTVADGAISVLLDFAEKKIANREFPDKAIDLMEQAVAEAIVAGRKEIDADDATRTTQIWQQRASSTPTLDRFGRELVALAKAGLLTPIVGRDRETDALTEILLRRTKRNPLLLGPAGSGKTAIVEGFAERVAAGQVPDALSEIRIFDVPIAALAGAVERAPDRLRDFLAEARHPSVVVFLDEIHQLSAPSSRILSESLKPALARGDIACVGATTGAEYQASIEPEAALARRFSPIQVDPMDDATVHKVLVAVRNSLGKSRGVQVSDDALEELISLADAYMPGRYFPDKGVDLVEQAIVYGMVHRVTKVDVEAARKSTAAFLGLDLDPTPAIKALETELAAGALLAADAANALVSRLGVTLRGLDSQAARPDAVVLLTGSAASAGDRLATAIASTIFGRATARIAIDLSSMTEDSTISTLLGSAPGLVGSDRALPLHDLRRNPRQVVLLAGIDRCATSIREVIAGALSAGSFTDAMGRTIPLSSAVVVATASEVITQDADQISMLLGQGLVSAADVLTTSPPSPAVAAPGGPDFVTARLLDPLARRFARSGYNVTFDPDFVTWLRASVAGLPDPASWMDRNVTPALLGSRPPAPGSYRATMKDGAPVLERAGR